MADMISSMIESFGGPVMEDVGSRFNIPPQMVKMATPMIVGFVVAGVKRLGSQPDGAQKLSAMMDQNAQRFGDRDLDSFVKEADPAKTAEALDALTGGNSVENVTGNLAGKLGVDPKALAGMLGVMAPAVINQLGGMAKEKGLDAQGVIDLVDQNADGLSDMGMDYILDNTPGIGDDIQRGFSKLFGGS